MYHLIKVRAHDIHANTQKFKQNIVLPQLDFPAQSFSIDIKFMPKPSIRIENKKAHYPSKYYKFVSSAKLSILKATNTLGEEKVMDKNINLYLIFNFKRKQNGDIDNLIKSALDIFKGILYKDDKQVKQVCARIRENENKDSIEVYYRYW